MGIGNVGDPCFGSEARNLCVHSTCEMTDIGGPFCESLSVECCITSQCAFPKKGGSPTCVCFNKKLAGDDGSSMELKLFDTSLKFSETFWLYYFLCGGVGFSIPGANDRPLLGMMSKELCIKQAVKLAVPVQDGVFCSGVGTQLCFWSQCELPPASGNPFFKCCNAPGGKGVGPMNYGKKPAQVEMS